MLVLKALTANSAKKETTVNVGFESLNCQIGKKKTTGTVNVGFESLNCQIGKKRDYRKCWI